jgi:hypothetical protein
MLLDIFKKDNQNEETIYAIADEMNRGIVIRSMDDLVECHTKELNIHDVITELNQIGFKLTTHLIRGAYDFYYFTRSNR